MFNTKLIANLSGASLALLLVVLTAFQIPAQITQTAYNLVQDEGSGLTKRTTLDMTGAGVTCSDSGGVTQCNIPAGSASQQHVISFSVDGGGSVVATGVLGQYPTAAYSCTINRWDISSDQSGSIVVDIWKAAGAIPTNSDSITAAAPPTLSAAQLAQNGSLTGWTTTVSSGDVFGGEIDSASTVTKATVQVWCQ